MSIARHLATIELLRTRDFPPEHGPCGVDDRAGASGPGYHLAELARAEAHMPDDGQHAAEYDALIDLLTRRLGEPQWISLWSIRERAGRGEAIPRPWYELSAGHESVHLWRTESRWLALAVADGSGDQPRRLIAAVTETDPP
ncbi:hypothetical protein [Streptomyces sp. NPDC088725]|uniref:hypothetical protein n=1 Tax=Streptomyces sp. NPDC088725 TaxID=3365873 RepID=UPI00381A7B3B